MTEDSSSSWKDELDALNAKITRKGSDVRQLKKDGADADVVSEAVAKLQELKIHAEAIQKEHGSELPVFNRKGFDDLILRKMFVVPSFEIHGGVKGLFDLGPPACALKVSIYYQMQLIKEYSSAFIPQSYLFYPCVRLP